MEDAHEPIPTTPRMCSSSFTSSAFTPSFTPGAGEEASQKNDTQRGTDRESCADVSRSVCRPRISRIHTPRAWEPKFPDEYSRAHGVPARHAASGSRCSEQVGQRGCGAAASAPLAARTRLARRIFSTSSAHASRHRRLSCAVEGAREFFSQCARARHSQESRLRSSSAGRLLHDLFSMPGGRPAKGARTATASKARRKKDATRSETRRSDLPISGHRDFSRLTMSTPVPSIWSAGDGLAE